MNQELYFAASSRAISSARGISRFSLIAGILSGLIAVFSLKSIGSGFFLFTILTIWFLVLAIWQSRQAKKFKNSAVLIDHDGVYLKLGGEESFFSDSEVCLIKGRVDRLLGFRKKQRSWRAFSICQKVIIADTETSGWFEAGTNKKLGGSILPLDADQFDLLYQTLGDRGWDRPCQEMVPSSRTRQELGLKTAYILGALSCFLIWLFLDNQRLGMAFLLGALGLLGLFLNSLYKNHRSEF